MSDGEQLIRGIIVVRRDAVPLAQPSDIDGVRTQLAAGGFAKC